MRRWLSLLLVWTVGAVMAQATISPQGIIVNPTPGDLAVTVWVDKDPGRSGNAVYQIGEPIHISVKVNRDAYVYLFNVNADGSIDLILPNAYDRNNYLRAGEERTYPPSGARYEFTITGPEGENYVLALASLRPLSLGEIADVKSGRMNLRGLRNLSQTLSIVVRPVPNREWATDAIRYYVGRRSTTPPPSTGTLAVSSSPAGAQVFIDGDYRGRTPLSIGLRPGMHSVELRLEGYESYRARVQVRAGQTTRLSPRLVKVVRTGTLEVTSSPDGAEVYVDGSYRGRTRLLMEVDAGMHDVEVRLDGYTPYRARVRVDPGATTRVYARLVSVKATLDLSVNVDAQVYLDGYFVGKTKNGRLVAKVSPGSRELVILAPGYHVYVETVRLDPGGYQNIAVRLERIR